MTSRTPFRLFRWLGPALMIGLAGLVASACEHYGYSPYGPGYRDGYQARPGVYVDRRGYNRRGTRTNVRRGTRGTNRRGTRGANRRGTRGTNRGNNRVTRRNNQRGPTGSPRIFTGPNGNQCFINQKGLRQCVTAQ